jgi:hypothetical protein
MTGVRSKLTPVFYWLPLLPLWEKVAAKRPDEGGWKV